MRGRNLQKANQRRGAVAVEMAIVSPLLVLLFMGMVQFGSILFTRHTIIHAAREGARQMAVEGATEAEARGVVEDYLAAFNITGATVTVQNVYKGNGDDAAARKVNVHVDLPPGQASILGDVLNVFAPGALIQADVSMRKEGELIDPPTP